MSVQEAVLLNSREDGWFSNRTLGLIGIVCSPMLFIASFFYAAQPGEPSPHQFLASLGGMLYLAGAMATVTAMRSLRVTGSGTGAAVLYVVQMTGLLLAMCFDFLSYAAPQMRDSWFFFVCDLAYPFSHFPVMLTVGIAVVKAKIWRGWRRAGAFLVAFALPSFFAASAVIGFEKSFYIFPSMVTAGFVLLALAVLTSKK